MKIYALIVFCSVLCLTGVQSQNFRPVNRQTKTIFKGDSEYNYYLSIDSAKARSLDSIYYPIRSITGSKDDCLKMKSSSFFGKKILIKNNGWTYFFNRQLDTLKINHLAPAGAEWVCFSNSSTRYVKAKILSIESKSVFGNVDSVKNITFSMHDENDNEIINHYISKDTLRISKKYGLILIPNINEFGIYNESFFEAVQQSSAKAIGLLNHELGWELMKFEDIYDFQVGDIFHERRTTQNYSDLTVRNEIRTILSRNDFEDRIEYEIEIEWQENKSFQFISSELLVGKDTIRKIYSLDSLLSVIPGMPFFREDRLTAFTNSEKHECGRQGKSTNIHDEFFMDDDSCWYTAHSTPLQTRDYYYAGLGGGYFRRANSFSYHNRELIYYKKGSETCGTPIALYLNETENIEFSIHPNPANKFIQVQSSIEIIKLIISNSLGEIVLIKNSPNEMINIDTLTPGTYHIELLFGTSQFGSKTLIVN